VFAAPRRAALLYPRRLRVASAVALWKRARPGAAPPAPPPTASRHPRHGAASATNG